MGRDLAALVVGILTVATVATVVSRDESATINGVGNLAQSVIRTSFGKG